MAPDSPQKIANAASAIHAELVKRRWAKISPANTNTFFTHWRGRIETTIALRIVIFALAGRRGHRRRAGGVETTTRHACAARRRLGSIRARGRPLTLDGNGSLRPLPLAPDAPGIRRATRRSQRRRGPIRRSLPWRCRAVSGLALRGG